MSSLDSLAVIGESSEPAAVGSSPKHTNAQSPVVEAAVDQSGAFDSMPSTAVDDTVFGNDADSFANQPFPTESFGDGEGDSGAAFDFDNVSPFETDPDLDTAAFETVVEPSMSAPSDGPVGEPRSRNQS